QRLSYSVKGYLLYSGVIVYLFLFFFQAEDGIRDRNVTGVQTCALPIFIASILNVILDLWFIAGLHMGVGGAALATILSQTVSAVLALRKLMLTPEAYGVQIGRASCRERVEDSVAAEALGRKRWIVKLYS